MNKLLYPANENGTYAIPVTFRDRDNSIVSDARVERVTVSLQNREGDYMVDRTVAAVGVQSVSLSGLDLQIEDQTKDQELRLFTVDAVVDDRPVHMEWEMFIKRLTVSGNVAFDSIFGGFSDETTTDSIFGGSSDQVYVLNGYFGGSS